MPKNNTSLIDSNSVDSNSIPADVANLLASYNYNLGKLAAFKWAWLVTKDDMLRHSLRVRAEVIKSNLINLKKELNNALNKTKYEIR